MNIKNIFFLGIFALTFFSCNPNKEIYEQLDNANEPYNESFSYTLTDEDYQTIEDIAFENATTSEDSAMAEDLGSIKTFSQIRKASCLIPAFLESKFIALDSSSAVTVVYKFDNQFSFDDNEIFNSDDTATLSEPPNDYLSILDTGYTNPVEDDYAVVIYTGAKYETDTTYEEAYALYHYNGTEWERPDNAFELTIQNYEDMGITGYYHNFSDDDNPQDLLPVFFGLNFPYSQANDQYQLLYKYYEGGGVTTFRYNKITYDGSSWNLIDEKNDQFIHTGKEWVFDPTVHFEMTCSDYQIIVDWISQNDTLSEYVDSYGTAESYFGASSYYCNFDMRTYYRTDEGNDPNGYLNGLTDDEISDIIWARMETGLQIFLEQKFPNATPFINGVQVYYKVTFETYEPERHKYLMKYLCTEVGEFEYVEGPTQVPYE